MIKIKFNFIELDTLAIKNEKLRQGEMDNKKNNKNLKELETRKGIDTQVWDRLVWQKALDRAIQKNRDKQVQKNIPH